MNDTPKIMFEKFTVEESEVIEGLRDGSLERYGCAIRRTSSLTITHFIVEPPQVTQSLQETPNSKLLNAIQQKSNQAKDEFSLTDVVNILGEAIKKSEEGEISIPDCGYKFPASENAFVVSDIPSLPNYQLSSILQVSQIAAAASVLNLGVSVAGFAYMGYKLNQVQNSLNDIEKSVEEGFRNVGDRLDRISGQLSYLYLLVQDNLEQQKRLENGLQEVRRLLLVEMLAKLSASIQDYELFKDTAIRDSIRTAEEVRSVLSDQAIRVNPSFSPEALLVADMSLNGWVVALMTKVQLLTKLGHYDAAIQVLGSDIERFKSVAQRWADFLISYQYTPKLRTAYRFAVPRLSKHISFERVRRIARISSRDKDLNKQRLPQVINEAEVELMLNRYSHLGDSWVYEQIAIAEYLDGMSETLTRLESFCSFLEECRSRGIKDSEELFMNLTPSNNLYLLPVRK